MSELPGFSMEGTTPVLDFLEGLDGSISTLDHTDNVKQIMSELSGFSMEGTTPGLGTLDWSNSTLDQTDNMSPSGMLVLAIVVSVLIIVVGFIGNFLSIVALLRCPRVRNVETTFIISLCIVDCLICMLVMPFKTVTYYYGSWVFGDTMCTVVPIIVRACIGFIVFIITTITINRYVMIAHPSMYARIYTPFWITVMIIFCCTLSFIMQVPPLFGYWGTYKYNNVIKSCTLVPNEQEHISKPAISISIYVLLSMIIIYCYARIFWIVYSSKSRVQKHAVSTTFRTSTRKEKEDKKNRKKEFILAKMILVIFITFIICYLPSIIVKLVDRDGEWAGLNLWSSIIVYLSTCINPIIYGVMNKQYREAYKNLLSSLRPSKLGPSSSYRVNFHQGKWVVETDSTSLEQRH